MATIQSLTNPTKDHPLYSRYSKTAMINKIVKLAVLAVIIAYLITVFFAPVFTMSTKLENADKKVMYEKSVSYTMSEIIDEQKKLNDEEKYFENVEDGVKHLKSKDFSEIERIKNLERANSKIKEYFAVSGYITDMIKDMSENRPQEYIALAEKANAIQDYTTNQYGERIPVISYPAVQNYLLNIEENNIAMLSKVFYAELESRNTDGLRKFLFEAEQLLPLYAAGYNSALAAELKDLQNKYLIADYTFDEELCATLKDLAHVNQFIPNSAMTKEVAGLIDMYKNMPALPPYSNASQSLRIYEAQYIYFEYDLDKNELVYDQHISVEYINRAVTIMKYGIAALIAIVVIAMIPTAIGLIIRKNNKLRSLSPFYAALPLLGVLLAFFTSKASLVMLENSVGATCEIGNVVFSALMVVLVVIIAAIVTKVLVTGYCLSYKRLLKETQANAQTAIENDAMNAAPVVEEAPVAEEAVEAEEAEAAEKA